VLGTGFAVALMAIAGGADLDACAVRVSEAPRSEAGYRCFRDVANRTGAHAGAFARLEGFLSADPRNDLARFTMAGLDMALGGKRAEALFEESIRGLAEDGEALLEARARLEWAAALQRAGRTDEAERHLSAVREIVERTGDEGLVAALALREAWQAFRRSDYAEAARRLEDASAWIESSGTPADRAGWLAAQGALHWALGRSNDAIAAYREEARIQEAAGDHYDAAGALANLVLLTSQQGGRGDPTEDDRRVLSALLDRAEAAARAGGNARIQGSIALYRAQLARDPEEVRSRLEEAIAGLEAGGDFSNRLVAMRYLAEVLALHEPRDRVRARALLDEAARIAYEHADLEAIVRARIVEASLAWRLGEEAYDASDRAIDAIEALRDLQFDEGVRAGVYSRWIFFYDRLIGYLLGASGRTPSRRDVEKAFEVAERIRARVLLERLDQAGVPLAQPSHAELVVARHRVIEEAGRLRVELGSPFLDDAGRGERLESLRVLEKEEAALRARLAVADPRFATLRTPTIPALGEVEEAIPSDVAIVAYTTGTGLSRGGYIGGGSWLLVHTRGNTQLYPVPPEEDLSPETALFAGLFESRDPSVGMAGHRLYERILGRALDELPEGIARITIVPDGPLHRVPFAALRSRPEAPSLAERYALSSAPSVGAWLRWTREAAPPVPPGAFVVADPWTGVLEPAEAREGEGPLPFARREARGVVARLPGRSRILEGGEATEAALKGAAFDRFGIVHIAAHACLDRKRDDEAFLVLASGIKEEDGRLTVAEASILPLRDRVVVLAACRTAGGPFVEGEGVESLALGFLVAGARAVIGSLWPLRDDETADFFDAFYRRLGDGAALAEAFAGAQRDRIAAGSPASAWAGLVLVGDGTVRLAEPGASGHTPLALLALAIAGAVVGWHLYRRLR
jgi:tetratricopeptide (TPR) repeat protein